MSDGIAATRDVRWLSGLRVLVTGAGGVLGGSLVVEAEHRGATVVASGRGPTLDDAALPDAAIRVAADLREPEECRWLVHEAARRMGGIDVVINNAATLVRKEFRQLELDDLESAWQVNLRAPALIMQESFEYLRGARMPAIVNLVSTAGISGGIASVSAYGMSKAGLIVLTKAVAREYGAHGIRVFALSPPTLASPLQGALSDADRDRVRGMNVLGVDATPEEVARFTLLAATGLGGLVTGTTIDLTAIAY